jgi:hypothetical protein
VLSAFSQTNFYQSASTMMVTRTLLRLFLAFYAFKCNVAVQYTSAGTTVDVSLEILVDENNSTKYCVDYKSGDAYGRDYEKACFTSLFADGATFRLCKVEFDDKECTHCKPCTASSGDVGYDLDCFNIEPSENTNACVVLNNENIQRVLVDTEFEGMSLLEFNMTEALEQANGNATGGETPPASSAGAKLTGVLGAGIIGFVLIL